MTNRPPRLLLFNETGEPGGAERVVVSLAEGFLARGVEVGVLTLHEGWLTETLDSRGILRHRISSERSMDVSLPFRINQLVQEHHYDMVHAHLLDSYFYGGLASKIGGFPFIGTEHGDVHHTVRRKFLRTKLRLLSLLGVQLTGVSNFTADALVREGVRPSLVSRVLNPAKLDSTSAGRERSTVRAELGVPEAASDHWLWVHAAIFFPVKDQRTLLRAFAHSRVSTDVPQSLLLLGDGPERALLESEVADLGIGEFVHFLGFRDDVGDWLRASDGFVLSSLSEAMPMSVIEAALAELAIISTDVGGVSDIIDGSERGLLVPVGDAKAMGDAMAALASDPSRARGYAEAAHAFVSAHCSIDAVLDEYAALYDAQLQSTDVSFRPC